MNSVIWKEDKLLVVISKVIIRKVNLIFGYNIFFQFDFLLEKSKCFRNNEYKLAFHIQSYRHRDLSRKTFCNNAKFTKFYKQRLI